MATRSRSWSTSSSAASARRRSEHNRVYRPWGYYQSIDEGERYQVKRIVVKPGQKLSLQKHYHRAEHWIVVRGAAEVTRDDESRWCMKTSSIYLPIGSVHRLVNPGKIDLELIEVQTGSYLGEDDIVRIEDVYQRVVIPSFASSRLRLALAAVSLASAPMFPKPVAALDAQYLRI